MTFDRISWPRHTARLALRPAATADLPAVFAVRTQAEVAQWMPDQPTSYDDWLIKLGRTGAIDRMLVMELDGAVIGDLYLHVTDGWAQAEVREVGASSDAEIGWCLSPAHQGHGYVTEAVAELVRVCFEDLGIRRLTATAFADNAPSVKVMERIGMVRESRTRRDSLHRSLGWVDGVTYSLLEDEYEPPR